MSIECKFCLKSNIVKNGFIRGVQRYKCKNCSKNFIDGDNRRIGLYPNQTRNMVIRMYLNNCGIRRISFILGIPLTTVFSWIKKAGQIVDEMVNNKRDNVDEIEILEMDELFTFVKKNQERIKRRGKESVNTPEYGLLWIGTDLKMLHLS